MLNVFLKRLILKKVCLILNILKKILVTGHTGFLGSHLTEYMEPFFSVFGVSDKISDNSKITQIQKEIQNLEINDIPSDISYIIHLAAITDIQYCQSNPTKCFDVNVNGTQNMLEISRKLNSKFIFLSTSHVYGFPKYLPINEDHPTSGTSIYSASKLASELLCEAYSKSYNLDCSILRLFSVYGPNSPQHLVTSKIISQFLKNPVLELGNTSSKRDFIFVNDVISAIRLVMDKSTGFKIFNVGNGKSNSILELCKLLEHITNKKITIKSDPSVVRKNDVEEIYSDISRIRELGWHPTVSMKEGLQTTLNWFQKN